MTTETSTPTIGAAVTLGFKGKPIRALTVDGVPWYCLRDMNDAVGWPEAAVDKVSEGYVPAFAMMSIEPGAEAAQDADDLAARTYLSPVGVLFWTCACDPWKGQSITAWAKREARTLCPKPPVGDRAMTLTVVEGADGIKYLPPSAPKFSGWKYDREDLRVSDEWFQADRENQALRMERYAFVDYSKPHRGRKAA